MVGQATTLCFFLLVAGWVTAVMSEEAHQNKGVISRRRASASCCWCVQPCAHIAGLWIATLRHCSDHRPNNRKIRCHLASTCQPVTTIKIPGPDWWIVSPIASNVIHFAGYKKCAPSAALRGLGGCFVLSPTNPLLFAMQRSKRLEWPFPQYRHNHLSIKLRA
ncbi:uncharacterized protein LOC119185199 isoform X2 [Rhipicephalus microplus]|uniref:uncharacterized protein LOC119185199 isoform X2 n=1 Tax=Rhipicephalus microplus TaxID=6941 RepID=UPI003F6B616F